MARSKKHKPLVAAKNAKSASKSAPKDKPHPKKSVQPFTPAQTILLVGEANLSFAVSILPYVTPALLVATCFDSEHISSQKYPDLAANISLLREQGVTVLFDIDATKLSSYKSLKGYKFDRIVFNFPHVGTGEKSESHNVKQNQQLLLRFLKSAHPFLSLPRSVTTEQQGEESDDDAPVSTVTESGTIQITLRTQKPYSLWDLPKLAKQGPLSASLLLPHPENRFANSQPSFAIKKSYRFDKALFKGYEHRRTLGFKETFGDLLADDKGEARTWELVAQ